MKNQCARCGSKRQRNLKYNTELNQWICIRCSLGNIVDKEAPKAYRMTKRQQKEVIRYKRQLNQG